MCHIQWVFNDAYDFKRHFKLRKAFTRSCCLKLTMFQKDPNSGVTKSKSGLTWTEACLGLQVRLPEDSKLNFHQEMRTPQHILHPLFSTQVMLDCRLRHLPLSTNRLFVLQEQHTGVEKYPFYSFQFYHARCLFGVFKWNSILCLTGLVQITGLC